jgi:hypothetical protein
MIINSDINIIGGLPDFGLILHFLNAEENITGKTDHQAFTWIKTSKAVREYKRVINKSLIFFENQDVGNLIKTLLKSENISPASLYLLFLNFSFNNHLLHYLNRMVYFPALYSGRTTIKADEVAACLAELKQTEPTLQKWSMKTILLIASKYLTLLKKFGLMEGTAAKTIKTLNVTDPMLIHFVYWLLAVEPKANVLESDWLKYAFSERHMLVERLLQKKFKNYISLAWTGDNLSLETLIPYQNLYDALNQS